MNINIQLLCMIISLIYGSLLYIANIVNKKLNNGKNFIYKMLIDIIYVYMAVTTYIVCIYCINSGIFHIYFIFILIAGYFLMSKIVKYLKNNTKFFKKICK